MAGAVIVSAALPVPAAHADNKRLNSAVVSAVYTLQHQAGCTNDVVRNNALTLAAEWHAEDMINNRNINDDIGSDGSTPQDRANAAGFRGRAAETVAINPAMAISSPSWSTSGMPTRTTWRSSGTAPTPPSGCGRTTAWTAPSWSPSTASPIRPGGSGAIGGGYPLETDSLASSHTHTWPPRRQVPNCVPCLRLRCWA